MFSRSSSSSSTLPWKPFRETEGFFIWVADGAEPRHHTTSCYPPTRDGNFVLLPHAFTRRTALSRRFHQGSGATGIRSPHADAECQHDSAARVQVSPHALSPRTRRLLRGGATRVLNPARSSRNRVPTGVLACAAQDPIR